MSINKEVTQFGPFKHLIADGVKVGNIVYLSGQVSLDSEGNIVGEHSLSEQVRQCYSNIAEILAKYDATMDNIVDEMWLVTDMQDAMSKVDEIFGIREEAYGGRPEVTQTMVQVSGLVMPELMIEIKCIAHL